MDERLSPGVPALAIVNQTEVVEGFGHNGMLRPRGLFINRQRPFEERLGFNKLTLRAVDMG